MRIGIYGGTFNPPHLGHLEAARAAVTQLNLDRLILIPAASPPHKVLPEGTAPQGNRFEMTQIMADGLRMPDVVEASDLEMARAGNSYTVDTVRAIHAQYPEAELVLLMGTDMFLTFHQWRNPQEIASLVTLCAFSRQAEDTQTLFAPQIAHLKQSYGASIVTIAIPHLVEVSSTQLRDALVAGEGAEYLLPQVYGYILLNGLYGTVTDVTHLDLPELRACSQSMVRAKRIPHILGTEEEAVRLAHHYGEDETLARRAAILHDCTKYLTGEEHLKICHDTAMELDALEQETVKLLHSKSGAAVARDVFGESDAIFWAIYYHTTAKADMSLLEKIIYIADFIEPNRTFDGVEEFRVLAYENIDAALLLGVESTIDEMTQRGKVIHPNTLQARVWLREQGVTLPGETVGDKKI